MPDEFHGDKTLLTSHETPSFSFLVMTAKLIIFNVTKVSIKLPLRLALYKPIECPRGAYERDQVNKGPVWISGLFFFAPPPQIAQIALEGPNRRAISKLFANSSQKNYPPQKVSGGAHLFSFFLLKK